jgi:hypothetical protein
MAGLVGREALGQVLPARATAQNPEDAVEDFARIPPGSAAPIGPAWRHWNQRFDDRPLFVRQFFTSCHAIDRSTMAQGFMRPLLVLEQLQIIQRPLGYEMVTDNQVF